MRGKRLRTAVLLLSVAALTTGWLRYGRDWIIERHIPDIAAYGGYWPVLLPLLALGVSPNTRYDAGPLLIIAFDGKGPGLITERVLLFFGADVNGQASGVTALMIATSWGDVAGVKLLLDHGADPNIVDRAGKSALLYLTPLNDLDDELEIVQRLVAAGADPCHRDHEGRSAADQQLGDKTPAGAFLNNACRKKESL